MSENQPVGRLAPSPTGLLHLGHARSFLLAWWHARARGGRVLMRIEDIDVERSRPEFQEALLRDLEWLGLDWDGAPVLQSERSELYAAALAKLDAAGRLYACVCTRREIELAQSAPHATDDTRAYPGTCRDRFASAAEAEAATGNRPALRFRVEPGEVSIEDRVVGAFAEDVSRAVGDFPVARSGGEPAYQLAVVVDDAEQGVTEVLRADDLLDSTPRQLLLQRALELASPTWCHVPLVTDAQGRRLAKRSDDLSLCRLREEGVDPRAVVAWAATSAGQPGPQRGTPADYLEGFDLARLPRAPARLGPAELALLLAARE